jgi:hypothetical protein
MMSGLVKVGVLIIAVVFLPGCAKSAPQAATTVPAAGGVDIATMAEIPAGNYLCNLQIGGLEQKLNFDIIDDELLCVEASERGLIGLRGKAQLIGNGVFLVQVRNEEHAASQFWIFGRDGTAVIKEIPDRGEKQKAVPVKGKTLEP